MKRLIAFSILFFVVLASSNASHLQAYLSYAIFNTPDNQPYIETYLVVKGSTLVHELQEDGLYQGALNIQLIFTIGDSIVNYGKYELFGPKVKDTSNINSNLLDVQRYALPEGDYKLELSIHDKFDSKDTIVSDDSFSVDFDGNTVNFSDVEFLLSFSRSENEDIMVKNGYEMLPYVFNYFPEVVTELNFYAELYNTKQTLGDDQFLLNYYIRPFEVDKKLEQFFFRKKMNTQTVNLLLNTIDITQLPSGNYLLIFEVRDRNNNLIGSKETFFQRQNNRAEYNLTKMLVTNPENSFAGRITERDSLVLYIDYLYPISTESEKNFATSLVAEEDITILQKYFLNFWVERDAQNPEQAWNKYKLLAEQANFNFSSHRILGYRTDRGRVYLKYGQPNTITESYNEPGAFPYEIWHYYELHGQRDKKFVFYTRDISTQDFQLIHSNAIGEINNYRWQTFIYERVWDAYNLDERIVPDSYGSFATDYYLQPR